MVSMIGILPGQKPLISDVRHGGSTPIRDVINTWAGVSEPHPSLSIPPPHDWSHRTDSGAGS
jgi:hypothetical protein